MNRKVEVAIIGAGTAGLNAMAQVRRAGKSFVLINGGELGTTCARVGCMPSKALIQIADDYNRREVFSRHAIEGHEELSVDIVEALEHVRDIRDILVDRVLGNSTDDMGDELLQDTYASIIGPGKIQAGEEIIEADKIILACGSTPVIPPAWRALGKAVITTDEFFEQPNLPKTMAVIGLGVIGLELGQALAHLGVDMVGIDTAEHIANLGDAVAAQVAHDLISKDIPLWLGHPAELQTEGEQIRVTAGPYSKTVDKVLVAMGRRPNISGLGLENLGITLNAKGLPKYDPQTMQIEDLPVFIAGDANGDLQILHEAGDEGRIAGYNASHDTILRFRRKTPLGITFTDPNICQIGRSWASLQDDPDVVVGEMPLGPVGRALIMAKNKGIIRVYANKFSGEILGATLICTRGENLAHLLAWAIELKLTAIDLLRMPFYHPTIEEALQAALYNLRSKLELSHPIALLELAEAHQP